jgi:hypothetical protein
MRKKRQNKEVIVKKLKEKFRDSNRHNFFEFEQIDRNDLVAMYMVYMPLNDIKVGYEVFLIKKFQASSSIVLEKYPNENDFGIIAFSFPSEKEAKYCFNDFCKNIRKKGYAL